MKEAEVKMSMKELDIKQVQQNLPQLIEEVVKGEDVIITQDNHPLVKMSKIEQTTPKNRGRRQAGSAKGMVWMSDDFEQPLEQFKDYT